MFDELACFQARHVYARIGRFLNLTRCPFCHLAGLYLQVFRETTLTGVRRLVLIDWDEC